MKKRLRRILLRIENLTARLYWQIKMRERRIGSDNITRVYQKKKKYIYISRVAKSEIICLLKLYIINSVKLCHVKSCNLKKI